MNYKNLTISLLIIGFLSIKAIGQTTQTVTEEVPEVYITEKGEYLNGSKEGEWKIYKNGTLSQKGKYKKGLKNGEWITYWYNGNIYTIANYENGIENGEWKTFYEDNLKWTISNYKNGKLDVTF